MNLAGYEVSDQIPLPPKHDYGIGIVGCGQIVRNAHLPAYAAYGCDVVGVYDVRPDAAEGLDVHVFPTLDELLADLRVGVVDVATHPVERVNLVRRALAAGKHVLAQKPLASDLDLAASLVDEAERAGLRFAVNQNGRWAPAWRVATGLVEGGRVGDVAAVTHLLDKDFGFSVGTWAGALEHFLIYDYCEHWIDISRCWLDGNTPVQVRAREYRAPNQPPESEAPWGGWIEIAYADGASVSIRSVGGSATSTPSCPFWIHGSEGTIRGSVLGGDFVELERDRAFTRYPLEGEWHVDGFAAAMGELMCAVAEDREPENSVADAVLSVRLVLAAKESAERGGAPVDVTSYATAPGS
jgi:predicted dehydrogenase